MINVYAMLYIFYSCIFFYVTFWFVRVNKDEYIEFTQEIGRRITTITEDTRETTFLFQRFSMALQRGNAVSFQNTMVTE